MIGYKIIIPLAGLIDPEKSLPDFRKNSLMSKMILRLLAQNYQMSSLLLKHLQQ